MDQFKKLYASLSLNQKIGLAVALLAVGFGLRYLLSMKLPAADEQRVNELSARARAGSLTESERQDLENYLHIGTLLGVMQSKARRLIKTVPQNDPMQQ